jgi:hypothetical protein
LWRRGERGWHLIASSVLDRWAFARKSQRGDAIAHGHQSESRDEYRADLLTFLALNFDFSIPTNPHQLSKASSVILIALVHTYGQGRVCMPRINANDR